MHQFHASIQFVLWWSSVAYHTLHLSLSRSMCICALRIKSFHQGIAPSRTAAPSLRRLPLRRIVQIFPYHPMQDIPKLIMVQPNSPHAQPSAVMPLYMPAPAPAPFCKCPKYCLLVVFHAAMYFSMQFVKVVCSEEEMEEPGLGMARSKQCSLTFCERAVSNNRAMDLPLFCCGVKGLLEVRQLTSTRNRAFCRAACWRTCCMTSVFASRAILMGCY